MSPVIGTPQSRADGRAKVTGGARYTADTPVEGLTYGAFALCTIPNGRITGLDTTQAENASGVLKVLTHRNTPKLNKLTLPPAGQTYLPLQDDQVRYEGQPLALAVAETLEQAIHAASLVRATYAPAPALIDFRRAPERAAAVKGGDAPPKKSDFHFGRALEGAVEVKGLFPADTRIGNVEEGLTQAAVRIEHTYRTADRHHNPMEPSATIAEWRDGKLTMYDSTQWVWGVRQVVAKALGIKVEDIRVRVLFVGGGFGCKGWVWPHQILAAVAAREVGRPVKVVLTRAQTYTSHGYQPATEQHVTLGATRGGRLLAIRHTSVSPVATFDDFLEYGAIGTRSMYACPAIETKHRGVRVHRGPGTPMRAPLDGLSMVGLECAMDELAVALGIDPVELRLMNYAEKEPTSGKPFSSKALRECYKQGAERFGWSRRTPKPGSMREGRDLVGWGMASAIMATFRNPAQARVTREKGGTVLIEAGTQEIGTGVYTILPQIAADVLGIPVEQVRLVLGDTTLPETGGTFGSSTTMSVGSTVHDAATKLKAKLAELGDADAPDRVSAEGGWSPEPPKADEPAADPKWSMHSFGAVFVEVKVDEDLLIPRLRRCVGVYSAGRIINPKTARSQMIGGLIWGLGQALLEQSAMDHTLGRYLSKNLSGYLVPVNADVPALDVHFVDEVDPHASTIGARGIGELAAVGMGPAIANAVFHATGQRIRDLPITPEKLLEQG